MAASAIEETTRAGKAGTMNDIPENHPFYLVKCDLLPGSEGKLFHAFTQDAVSADWYCFILDAVPAYKFMRRGNEFVSAQ